MENIISPENLLVGERLLVAVVLGMVLGLERVIAHKTAGMRTYALVALGSALFVITGELVARTYGGSFAGLDPLRIASQVVMGVGFLGAGLIFNKDSQLFGLTTASGLWVAAGIGIAAGFGLYVPAFCATLLTLLIFTALWFIEDKVKHLTGEKN